MRYSGKLLLPLALLFLISAIAYAATFTLEIQLTNPGAPVDKVAGELNIPVCFTVKSYPPAATWDSGPRILTVNIGHMDAGETVVVPVQVEGGPECSTQAITGHLVSEKSSQQQNTSGGLGPLLPGEAPIPTSPVSGAGTKAGGGNYLPLNSLPPPVAAVVGSLRSSPGAVVATKAAVPVVTVAGAATAAAITANAVAASAHVFFGQLDYLRFLFFGFLKKKTKNPWGKVYNQWTNRPIMGAVVSILDPVFGKVKETQITDQEGRFGFLVTPGNYFLKISKPGFATHQTQTFNVGADSSQLNLDIGLLERGGAILPKALGFLGKMLRLLNNFLYAINPYVLAIGTVLSVASFLVIPNGLNLATLIAYGVLDILKIIFFRISSKSYGVVVDKFTSQPLALSVVRLFSADTNWLVGTRVTNQDGRFTFLLVPGSYYLSCNKTGYAELKTQPTEIKKASLVTQAIELEPAVDSR